MRAMLRSTSLPLALVFVMGACKQPPSPSGSGPSASASALSPAPSAPAVGIPVPAASVEAILNPAKLPPYSGPTGSVEGTVFLTGDEAPEVQGKNFATCPDAAKTRGKLFRTSEEGALGTGADRKRPVADAIVAVTGYSGFYLPEREEAHRLVLEECSEVPRTVVMTFGQRLEIENKSKIIFAPQLMQGTVGALMVATPGAEAVKLYPARPGRYAIDDRLAHDTGTMDLYVLLQSAHGVSDRKGHYRIDGLPLGQLTVNARLAAISVEAAQPFEVKAGVVQHVDLILNYTKAVAPAASASASTSASGAGADAGAAASGPNAKTSPGVAPAKPVPALR